MNDLRETFLNYSTFAVAGASRDRSKYGNIVYRALLRGGRKTFPLNPNTTTVEGNLAYAKLSQTPATVEALSIVTPPATSLTVVRDAIQAGVKSIWFQPGAENEQASQLARAAGLDVIDDGSCILVTLARS
jgi:predicted CoA-binding protein